MIAPVISKMKNARDQIPVRIITVAPSDALCRHKYGSTSDHVMTCSLTTPSRYMKRFDFSLLRFNSIHLKAISMKFQGTIWGNEVEHYTLELAPHLQGTNELLKDVDMLKLWNLNYVNCVFPAVRFEVFQGCYISIIILQTSSNRLYLE